MVWSEEELSVQVWFLYQVIVSYSNLLKQQIRILKSDIYIHRAAIFNMALKNNTENPTLIIYTYTFKHD